MLFRSVFLPLTTNHTEKNLVRLIFGVASGTTVSNILISLEYNPSAADEVRVYSLSGLKTSTRLDDYAKSFIKLPAPVAAEINQNAITPPTPQVQVTSVPVLGTVTALAPSWKYTLTRGEKGRSTKVQIGNRITNADTQVVLQTIRNADTRDAANARIQGLPSVLP